MDDARRIRDFWLGPLPASAVELEDRSKMWFGSSHDDAIRQEFGPLLERAMRGELDGWADSPRRRLSLIVLLDQFSRNIYRGTSRAFANDDKALSLALTGMQSGADAALDPVERMFFYMPLQHSELAAVQEEAVRAFKRLAEESPPELRALLDDSRRFAEAHRDIIVRFGRFPHRNRALGRATTPEEWAYLKSGGETFGQ